ncbi:next to BRCA1 gene 1 protein isoform X2 [Cavia porcellus]|uniref:next to BRCA1 gene 1 protein isoform X2 n=1 Tax=Cavia porcellus TaxID=10141 RepID=UPI000350F7FA
MRPAGVAVELAPDAWCPGLQQAPPGGGNRLQPHSMEPQVTLNVTFRNETQSFLVSDPENTTWADVEAMVKVSFDLNTIQIKYLDEENEEISINSQGEYEEALKMAGKQGHQLQMQVLAGHLAANEAPAVVGAERHSTSPTGKKPLAHYSALVRAMGSELRNPAVPAPEPFPLTLGDPDHTQDRPPDWFTRSLETFREQVVKETVEKLEQRFQLILQSPPGGSLTPDSALPAAEEAPPLPVAPFSWPLVCSGCHRRIVGTRYQCSLCPSYNICEACEAGPYAHSASHVLLKLRRPVPSTLDPCLHPRLPTPQLPTALEQVRLQKQVDKNLLKAEKQRLRAEKKQRKAEVKELKKQLKLHRKIHLWSSLHGLQGTRSPPGRPESLLPPGSLGLPTRPNAPVLPTFGAAFVDENLPDGTHLPPGTRFLKHWRMRNTGTISWSADTKLKFMWGNLTLASAERKDVLVPFLEAGHVGVVSVEFVAPALEGTYTSHWRLAQNGQQFGPRVWCSIVVDPSAPAQHPSDTSDMEGPMSSSSEGGGLGCPQEDALVLAKGETPLWVRTERTGGTRAHTLQKAKSTASEQGLYIPSVDLTAQDLLSFELLDINIVQELEQVPHNTPVDSTAPGESQVESTAVVEDVEEDLSGTQFVCETVIRSLTLDAAPDHNPPCRPKAPQQLNLTSQQEGPLGNEEEEEDAVHLTEPGAEQEDDEELGDEVQSQSSSSSEDYIIVLPECFDTSRPLSDSMYSAAPWQPGPGQGAEDEPRMESKQEPTEAGTGTGTGTGLPAGESPLQEHIPSPFPEAFQTLEMTGLLPAPPRHPVCVQPGSPGEDVLVTLPESSAVPRQMRAESRSSPGLASSRPKSCDQARHLQGSSIAGGLVKGALSVATSAYKALFSGPPVTAQPLVSEPQTAALMAHLFEMGFCDRQLNLWLLKKHNHNLLQVVTELLQLSNNDWYSQRY